MAILDGVEDPAPNMLISTLAAWGIAAHGHDTMPTTYHRPRRIPSTGFALDDRPDQSSLTGFSPGSDKPAGALWSAPGRVGAEGTVWTAWTDWMALEGTNRNFSLVPLTVTPGGVVIRIDDAGDAERLAATYPVSGNVRGRFDWPRMRADGVDGVWLTAGGVDAVNRDVGAVGYEQPAIAAFDGWDVSSVAWLSTAHLAAETPMPVGAYRAQLSEYGSALMIPDGLVPPLDEGVRPPV